MSEENKAIAHRYLETFSTGNQAVVDEIISPDYVHTITSGMTERGIDFVKQQVTRWRTYFPDFNITVEEMIAEGDKVVTRWTARGTHKGEYQGIPPTDKQVEWSGVDIYGIVGGKIVETWRKWDRMGLLEQLGAVPQS